MESGTGMSGVGGATHLLEATLGKLGRADSPYGQETTLGALLDALDERAFGLLLLILALPCCIPFLYGIPQVVSLPMAAIAFQVAQGRSHPWLPRQLRARRFDAAALSKTVGKLSRYIRWAERLATPRLTVLTEGVGLRIVGGFLLIPVASILTPIPGSNTAPGIGVAIASVGLLERDGLLVLAGLIFGLLWVAVLFTAIAFFGMEAGAFIKGFFASGA